jgi:Glycosyl transferase family group 2
MLKIRRIDVMQVAHHYFENGIAHFTRRINKCISMSCANGEVAPFVGHNAFLRWSALQDAAFEDSGDNNKKKIWSEVNVSEDFDMALRLQVWFLNLGWGMHQFLTDCRDIAQGIHYSVVDLFGRWLQGRCLVDVRRRTEPVAEVLIWWVLFALGLALTLAEIFGFC